MKQLIVGMDGTIGSALYQRLQTQADNIYGTTYRKTALESPNDHIIYLDLGQTAANWDFKGHSFDVAYLCAGVCRMNLCESDPKSTRSINVDGMEALIQRLTDAGTFIIYLSTNQVFSGREPYAKVDAPYEPVNEYGRQKAEVEIYIKSHSTQYAIVRLTKVVEPGMLLIQNWIDQIAKGTSFRAFADMPLAPISIRYVVDTLILIGQKMQTGIYHLSGTEDVSYHQLATYLSQCLERDPTLVQSTSALDAGIQKNFLPQFTSLDCSSTIALSGKTPPKLQEVLHECFGIKVDA